MKIWGNKMNTERKFGIAIIGAGKAASNHAMALASMRDCVDVRGVYSRNPEKCRKFAERYKIPAIQSIDELCKDPLLDAVIIATPPNARLDLVGNFTNAGKHILLEKPVGRALWEANSVIEMCKDANVTLGIAFHYRFRVGTKGLKLLLNSERLGDIHTVQLSVPWWRPQSYYDEPGRGTIERDGGGVLMTQAIHSLDQMLHLVGPVDKVQAIASTSEHHAMETEDFVAGALIFSNGAVGSLMATTASYPGGPEVLELSCEKASVRLEDGMLSVYWIDGGIEIAGVRSPCNYERVMLIEDFIDAVKSGRQPAASGHEALESQYLIDALLASSASGKITEVKT